MKFFLIILLMIITGFQLAAQNVLYKSKEFIVTLDKVIEGKYKAVAESREEIQSSYQSSYKLNTPSEINFKFSINGLDNEREPGQDHHLILNPDNGKFTSPLYVFGRQNPKEENTNLKSNYLSEDTELLLRVDMRDVLNSFKTKGYYLTYNGDKIYEKDFKGVYVAGGVPPLSWDFSSLPDEPQFKLADPDGDGIYEIKIDIKKIQMPGERKDKWIHWKLSKDISSYPSYHSPDVLIDALYNKALEEMILDTRPDGAFMAGAKWPGVWTRDISYSIFLSLAMVNPDAAKTSLMAKVKNERIIQDTGTGGAWPVSSDRFVWAIAAWEVYKSTGDMDWLKESYNIIKNSAEDDLSTVFDKSTGLFRGESSFLDWREQTYPRWMDPKDIYTSECLGTNAVHYQAFVILAKMAKILGYPSEQYLKTAQQVKEGMNKLLWLPGKDYYGQYRYGRNFLSLSTRAESLGEALSVLFGVPGAEQQKRIIENSPVTKFGATCIYPQTPGIPPYHNNAVWPFVESFWAWASAKTGNIVSVEHALASVYRAAALFMTNKENMVASTGDYLGTEINSDRQLWSVAGNLSLVYRVLFGISLHQNSLSFDPFIPESYSGERELNNFKYRNAALDIIIKGFGNKIKSITMDGKPLNGSSVPGNLTGRHKIKIEMNNQIDPGSHINLAEDLFAPETPVVKINNKELTWLPAEGAVKYLVFKNGEKISSTTGNNFKIQEEDNLGDYQVLAVDKNGLQSFLSEPVTVVPSKDIITIKAESGNDVQDKYAGYTGSGYVLLDKNKFPNQVVKFDVDIPASGNYSIDFRYANGEGPINTDNKCAVRTLSLDNKILSPVILPQRGVDAWTDWGFSNSILTYLAKGHHTFSISFLPQDNNMNIETNNALLDYMRLIRIK